MIHVVGDTIASICQARAASLQARAAAAGGKPARRDPYPLKQKPTPTWGDAFAPLIVPLMYSMAIVGVMCAAVWLVRASVTG